MKRKLWFLLLVGFFVTFGGSRSGRWAVVASDTKGHVYELNLREVKRESPFVFKLDVRVTKGSESYRGPWLLDVASRTVEAPGFPKESYGATSVPARMEAFLKEHGYFSPSLSLPAHSEAQGG